MRSLLLSFMLCTLLAACASRPSQSYQVVNASGETVTVVSVKRVRVQDPPAVLPTMIAGAAIGSLLGPKVMALQTTVNIGTGPASIAGAAAGAVAAPYLFTADGLEIVALRSNGDRILIVQPRNDWTPMIGQLALLVSTGAGPRLIND